MGQRGLRCMVHDTMNESTINRSPEHDLAEEERGAVFVADAGDRFAQTLEPACEGDGTRVKGVVGCVRLKAWVRLARRRAAARLVWLLLAAGCARATRQREDRPPRRGCMDACDALAYISSSSSSSSNSNDKSKGWRACTHVMRACAGVRKQSIIGLDLDDQAAHAMMACERRRAKATAIVRLRLHDR